MAVYVAYRESSLRSTGLGTELELLPSQEHAGRVLRRRVRLHHSETYYLHQDPKVWHALRPQRDFPGTDHSAYFMVWLLAKAQGLPRADQRPHERWTVTDRGGLVRTAWTGPHTLLGDDDIPVPARTLVPAAAVCGSCYQIPSTTGRCGCS